MGLRLYGRDALKQLIADVEGGRADFGAKQTDALVYLAAIPMPPTMGHERAMVHTIDRQNIARATTHLSGSIARKWQRETLHFDQRP